MLRPMKTKFAVLETVVQYCEEARYGPTISEIADTVGVTAKSTIQSHVNDLISDGLLTRIPRKHRSVRPTEKGVDYVRLMSG